MIPPAEVRRRLQGERGIYVTEACDRCGQLLGPVRFTRKDELGVWCSRECRSGKPRLSSVLDAALLGRVCGNPKCKRGEGGQRASLAHLRAGAKYCSESCKKQSLRNGGPQEVLTGTFDPSQPPVLRGFSRDVSAP